MMIKDHHTLYVRVFVCLCVCAYVCVFSEGSNTLLLKNVELPCIIMVLKTKEQFLPYSPIVSVLLLVYCSGCYCLLWLLHGQ